VVAVTDDRIVPVTMPKWGLSMRLGKITAWIVAEGDDVNIGDDLADVETEKINGTLEAADAGTVRRLIAQVGEDVPVSGTIALIAPAEVGDDALDAAVAEARMAIDAGVPDDAGGGPEVETADVGGRKISYAGAGADGDVILLVHGYGGDRNSWLFLQEPMAAKYRVYALDLPGHGTSGKDVGDGTLDVLADAVAGVLDALGAARAHLVGHSMGGAVALAVAARDPGRIASLTLIAPAGFGAEINAGYLRGFAEAQTRRELKPVVSQLFADESLVTRQLVDDLLAYKRLDGVSDALHALLDTMLDGDAQRPDSTAALAATGSAVPVTVVWGRADRIIPAVQAEAVAGAVRRFVDRAGHMPHMERPGEVQAAIEETITRAGLRLAAPVAQVDLVLGITVSLAWPARAGDGGDATSEETGTGCSPDRDRRAPGLAPTAIRAARLAIC
jgi:pyruvate dehydrogenase E2 component (dihydrolipoyllysine-residue acetyltransferase)